MLLQALVGGAAGLLVALKLYWYELTRFWRRLWAGLRPGNKTSGQATDTSPASAEPYDSH